MVKKYWLFEWVDFYSEGGMDDFVKAFDSLVEMNASLEVKDGYCYAYLDTQTYEWFHAEYEYVFLDRIDDQLQKSSFKGWRFIRKLEGL